MKLPDGKDELFSVSLTPSNALDCHWFTLKDDNNGIFVDEKKHYLFPFSLRK